MTDTMTPEQRHRCMSHIRSTATKPELLVRQWLWNHGYRYRLNVKSVPGKPDIVMRPYRTAIFVNGCFWHGHNVRMRKCGNALMRECGNGLMCEGGNALMREGGNALMCECGNGLMRDGGNALMREGGNALMREGGNGLMRECGNALMREGGNALMREGVENSACCKIPQTNRDFWLEKIRRNQERDKRNYQTLQDNGWQVIVVWECQLKADKLERTMREVELALNNNLLSMYKHNPIPYPSEEERLPMAAEGEARYK